MSKEHHIQISLHKNLKTGIMQPWGMGSRTEDEEILCNVVYHVTPGEPRTHWEPGCSGMVEIDEVTLVSDGSDVEEYNAELICDWIREWEI